EVVIPAHNEGHNVADLARSLASQDYQGTLRFVLALDRCTDDTRAVLERTAGADPRFIIHDVAHWEPGWAGKVNAVWEGVKAGQHGFTPDLLLFADADTVFDPACVRACVKLLHHRGAGMISLLSTLAQRTWFEKYIQPATGLELLRQFPPLAVNRDIHSRSLANGQFMLIRREVYQRVGGHAALTDALLEDIKLAALVKHAGAMSEIAFADGMLLCKMYDTWDQFVNGWKRIYVELANRKPSRLRKAACVNLVFGTLLPIAALGAIAVGAWRVTGVGQIQEIAPWCIGAGIAGLALMQGCLIAGFTRGGASWTAAAAYPYSAFITARLLWTAARELQAGVPIRWAGREYVRPVR
nr:glycosyltransferase [Phycisphaerales bacterium]